MKVVVAPNSFKGTLTATQAAHAIARGVREVFPDAEIVEVPVADGGEGTAEALVSANGGTSVHLEGIKTRSLRVEGSGALKAELAGEATEQRVTISGAP